MARQVTKLQSPPFQLQWFFTVVLTTSSLFFSHAKPCSCSTSTSNHDRRVSYTWNTTFQQMDQGLLFRRSGGSDDESPVITLQPGSLGYYMGKNSSHSGFNLTDSGWFVIPKWFDPWKKTSHGDDNRVVDMREAVSFSIVFSMSAVTTPRLVFHILPRLETPDDSGGFRPRSLEPAVLIETLNSTTFHSGRTLRVTAYFQLPEEDDPNPARYSVQINYDRFAHNLSVYLINDADAGGTGMPAAEASSHLGDDDTLTPDGLLFAISSSMEQLLQLHTWSFTISVPETRLSRARAQHCHHSVLRSRIGSCHGRHCCCRLLVPELQVQEVEEGPGSARQDHARPPRRAHAGQFRRHQEGHQQLPRDHEAGAGWIRRRLQVQASCTEEGRRPRGGCRQEVHSR